MRIHIIFRLIAEFRQLLSGLSLDILYLWVLRQRRPSCRRRSQLRRYVVLLLQRTLWHRLGRSVESVLKVVDGVAHASPASAVIWVR